VTDRQRDFPQAATRAKRLRREPTTAESRFWQRLRTIEGAHFRRQATLGPYVFDFADLGARLLIELDGGIHDRPDVKERDVAKDEWASSQGFVVVRIPNSLVFGTGAPAMTVVMAAVAQSRAKAGSRKR
jgi:very-short-patch-repair endonuclease